MFEVIYYHIVKEITMNKSFWTRKNILLILIVIWNILLVLFYWKPYFKETMRFFNNDVIKYGIIGGSVSKQFVEEYIYYNFTLFGISIACIISELLFSVLSLKNTNYTKFISIGIFTQTIFFTLLNVWKNYFIDSYNETEIIGLKMWTIISIVICILLIVFTLLNNKIFYMILSMATVLQVISTIMILQSNRGFLLTQSITNPNYFSIIFQCVNGIILYILYWILLIGSAKSKSEE